MRIYNEYNVLTKNGNLSKFAKYKKNIHYSDYLLLSDFLESYGIGLFGAFQVNDSLEVHALNIDAKKFPKENWQIIKEFYNWTNLKVDIGLTSFTPNSETSLCYIELDTEEDFIVLKQLSFGAERFRKEYANFDDLWGEVSNHESIDHLKKLCV